MDRREVMRLVYIVTAAYPMHFAKYGELELAHLTDAWLAVLGDYTYAEGQIGLKAYLATDKNGFPPSVGQVVDKIVTVTHDEGIGPLEAWALVRRAARNGTYGAEEEFEKLPEDVQVVVGTPSNLRAMAAMSHSEVESVEKSHFLRNYEALKKQRREEARLPLALRRRHDRIEAAADQLLDGPAGGEALRPEGAQGEAQHDTEQLLLGFTREARRCPQGVEDRTA